MLFVFGAAVGRWHCCRPRRLAHVGRPDRTECVGSAACLRRQRLRA